MHHMGILSNRSIFGPLFSLKLNSCTYYVQYNTNLIGLLYRAIRDHNDYVMLLFSKHSIEFILSHFTWTKLNTAVTQMWDVTLTCQCNMSIHLSVWGATLIYWILVSLPQGTTFCPPKGSAKIKQLPVIQNVQTWPSCCCPLVAPSL